jgi:AcrR family transcriptional regulator
MGKTKQAALNEFRCGEILEAARKVFARKGFRETTVEEIADAAGVAKGTVYLYFESKREIYFAALKSGLEDLNRITREEVGRTSGARAKIRAFVCTRARYAEEHRDFFRIYHHEFANLIHPGSIDKDFRDMCRKQASWLEELLNEAVHTGEIARIDTSSVSVFIYDVTRSLIIQRLLGWSRASLDADIDTLCEFIWRGIGK